MKIRRIDESEFGRLQVTWNEILEKSRANEVFLLWEWIDSWWKVFRNANRELFILGAFNDLGEAVGFAPLYRERAALLGIRYGKILKLCGNPETYPDHLDLFCRKESEEKFVKAVFQYLKEHDRDWDCLDLCGLAESSAVREVLTHGDLNWNGHGWSWRDESNSPYLETTGGFSGYLNSFSRKKRYNLIRTRKLLVKEENWETKKLLAPQEIEKYYDTLVSLHAERAKRKGIRSTFTEEKVGHFHKTLIRALLTEGKIAFTILYKNDRALAASYCLRHNRKYYFYQSGISIEGERCSAGLVLLSWIVEKCFDEGCLEFDFLQGSEEYKKYWTNSSRKSLALEMDKGTGKGKLTRMIYDCQKKTGMAKRKIGDLLRDWRACKIYGGA